MIPLGQLCRARRRGSNSGRGRRGKRAAKSRRQYERNDKGFHPSGRPPAVGRYSIMRHCLPPGKAVSSAAAEGWLLVENHRVVGAAEFTVDIGTSWLLEWIFVDLGHRRQGIASTRMPMWVKRYGRDMLVDQPNPPASLC